MAIYFKCPLCGQYFMDCFGEYAVGNDNNANYICPKCRVSMEQIDEKEYADAPYELKAYDTQEKNFMNYRILNQKHIEEEESCCGSEFREIEIKS